MPGIYGEFLGFFSELYETFKVYKQTPDVVSGYSLEFSRNVTGIRQSISQGIVDKKSGRMKHEVQVMDIGSSYTLWTQERIDPATEFVEIDGSMYRPMTASVFNREGGFYEITVDMIVGNDGTKNEEAELAEGVW